MTRVGHKLFEGVRPDEAVCNVAIQDARSTDDLLEVIAATLDERNLTLLTLCYRRQGTCSPLEQ